MPALVKSSVGSSCGTTGPLGTAVCAFFCAKKSMNVARTRSDGHATLLLLLLPLLMALDDSKRENGKRKRVVERSADRQRTLRIVL